MVVKHTRVPKRESTGGLILIDRSEDLTTKYLTPQNKHKKSAAGTVPAKATLLRERAAKARGGCPSGAFLQSALGSWWSAPRRVLMRCMTSIHWSSLLVDRSFIFVYFWGFPCCVSQTIRCGKHLCVNRQQPISQWDSSSKQSLLGKACLFSSSEIKRILKGVMRQVGAWRIIKNKKATQVGGQKGNYGGHCWQWSATSHSPKFSVPVCGVPRSLLLRANHLYQSIAYYDSGIKGSAS